MSLPQFLANSLTPFEELTRFGIAGLMGAMWLWERRTSQKREQQIDEAHARIMSDRIALDQLMATVRQNAEALARFSATQEQLLRQIGKERITS